MKIEIRGFIVHKKYLDSAQQQQQLSALRKVISQVPLFCPNTPYDKPMSVKMTSAGRYGWFSDRKGYCYIRRHPSGQNWPDIPESILRVWSKLVDVKKKPDCCLINFYGKDARMGMHQDRDEADFSWPVLSISLGDDCLFRMGNSTRGGSTESLWLQSGDVVLMSGDARLKYHGVDRIRFGSSRLLPKGGRINLTLRVVD
ncbi:MAG: alpha-ketoglutarate-dependent dioxygenase AlkB [Aestuariivita sp.]|nr:alpha-ketoglutarate-dependent dioxygenase AlkB [Aestuariivita sp.]